MTHNLKVPRGLSQPSTPTKTKNKRNKTTLLKDFSDFENDMVRLSPQDEKLSHQGTRLSKEFPVYNPSQQQQQNTTETLQIPLRDRTLRLTKRLYHLT